MILRTIISAILFLFGVAIAHGGTSNYTVNGVWYRGYAPYTPEAEQDGQPWLVQRKWTSIDPIFEPSNSSLPCNYPGDPAPAYIPIAAGDNLTAVYYYWLHTVGPMVLWLADCGASCAKLNLTEAKWFKIAERGLLSGTIQEGQWGQREFQVWDGAPSLWTETLPRNLRPGKYIARHEIIALHIANRPQFYPECAHLEVTGNGTSLPSKKFYAKIPGVWSMNLLTISKPEINIDVYAPGISNLTSYQIPGPPVWHDKHSDGLDRLVDGFKGPREVRPA